MIRALGKKSTVLLLNAMSRKFMRVMFIFHFHSFMHLDIITSFISATECTTRLF